MGTKMTPSYASIFMAELEEAFLSDRPIQPTYYKRYIDDILIIWTGNEEDLDTLLTDYNRCHPKIKFTYNTDRDKLLT